MDRERAYIMAQALRSYSEYAQHADDESDTVTEPDTDDNKPCDQIYIPVEQTGLVSDTMILEKRNITSDRRPPGESKHHERPFRSTRPPVTTNHLLRRRSRSQSATLSLSTPHGLNHLGDDTSSPLHPAHRTVQSARSYGSGTGATRGRLYTNQNHQRNQTASSSMRRHNSSIDLRELKVSASGSSYFGLNG